MAEDTFYKSFSEKQLTTYGGRGSIFGTVLGCLIIGVLNNGLVLVGVSPDWQLVVKGAVIIAAVAIDRASRRED